MVRNTHSQFAPLARQHFETPRRERKALRVLLLITLCDVHCWFLLKLSQSAALELQPHSPAFEGLIRAEDTQGSVPVPCNLTLLFLRGCFLWEYWFQQVPAMAALTLLDFSLDAARSQLFLTTCGILSGAREVSQPTAVGAPPWPTYSSLVIHKQTSHCRRKRWVRCETTEVTKRLSFTMKVLWSSYLLMSSTSTSQKANGLLESTGMFKDKIIFNEKHWKIFFHC